MSYNPNIPLGNQSIASTTSPIQTNFSQLNTAFAVDHTAYSILSNQGMHKQVTLQAALVADPNQVTPISTLYTKASSSTTTSDLYFQNGALSSNVVQVTGGGVSAAAWVYGVGSTISASYNVTSMSFAGTAYTINFTRAFASANYAVIVTLDIDGQPGNATGVLINSRSTTSVNFTVRNQLGGTPQFPFSAVFFGTLA